ncbi:hypothetical protein [Candidatus Thioglobus sp.]|uniref:hypothetical protein n=1 Tax=Candidatus Thioglobus sp. TaxID=2026721 RepID=UPI003D10BC46
MQKLLFISIILFGSITIADTCTDPFKKSLTAYSEGRIYIEEAEVIRQDYKQVGKTPVLCKMHQISKDMLKKAVLKFESCVSNTSSAYYKCNGKDSKTALKNKKHCALNVKLSKKSLAKTQKFLDDYCKYDYNL